MNPSQVEIQDNQDSDIEHSNTVVTTAGVPVVVSRTDTKPAQLVLIKNPNKGIRANNSTTVIYFSLTGETPTTGISISRGETMVLPGIVEHGNLKIDSNEDGANAEIVLWG